MTRVHHWGLMLGLLLTGACGGSATQQPTVVATPDADPEAVRLLVSAGRLVERGNAQSLRRAERRLNQALAIDPSLWEAHYNLGVLARRRGELDAAATHFEAALAVAPEAPAPLRAAAEVAYAQGHRAEAARRLRELVERVPEDLAARTSLAVVLRESERWDEALEVARAVLVRDPSQGRALLEVGRVYRNREQPEVALLVLEKALVLGGDDARFRAEVLDEQGRLELGRGDTQAAFEAFDGAIAADASYTPARMNMGSVLLHAGDYAGAAAQYAAVLEVGEDEDARVALGIALRGQGDNQGAARAYRAVLDANPEHPDAVFNFAVLRAEFLDERSEARGDFERFLRIAPSSHPRREAAEEYLRLIPAPAPEPTP